jgi:hypothetical protein
VLHGATTKVMGRDPFRVVQDAVTELVGEIAVRMLGPLPGLKLNRSTSDAWRKV